MSQRSPPKRREDRRPDSRKRRKSSLSKGPFTQAIFVAATLCNFCRAEVATSKSHVSVNQLRFRRDFSCDLSQLVAAISQEFRPCSKLDAILRRFLTKLNHKGPLGRFCHMIILLNISKFRFLGLFISFLNMFLVISVIF